MVQASSTSKRQAIADLLASDTTTQGVLGLEFKDEISVEKWVAKCLSTKNDDAIISAVTGMQKFKPEQVMNAINTQFNDFEEMVGRRRMRVKTISIPIGISSQYQMDEGLFIIKDVKQYLQHFYKHGLIEKSNGGIVLLNRLVDHVAIENTSLSDLYMLSRAMFESARAGSSRLPYVGNFGEGDPESSWLFTPEGFYTMRHLIGVVFWDESKPRPPIAAGGASTVEWQKALVHSLMMDVLSPNRNHATVSVLEPKGILDSVLSATTLMVEKVVRLLAVEGQEQSGEVESVIAIGDDAEFPGHNLMRVSIHPMNLRDHVAASATIRLSVMETANIVSLIERVRSALSEEGVTKIASEYFVGAMQDEISLVHLH